MIRTFGDPQLRVQVVQDLAAGRTPTVPVPSADDVLEQLGLSSGNGRSRVEREFDVAFGDKSLPPAQTDLEREFDRVFGDLLAVPAEPPLIPATATTPTEARPPLPVDEGREYGFRGEIPEGVTPVVRRGRHVAATEAMNAVRKPVFEAMEKQADEDRWLEARRIARLHEGLPLGASKEEIEEYQRATRRPSPPITRATEEEEPGAWARFTQGAYNLTAGQISVATKIELLAKFTAVCIRG